MAGGEKVFYAQQSSRQKTREYILKFSYFELESKCIHLWMRDI